MKKDYIIIWLAILLGMMGCAKSGTLGGGPKDTTPPMIVKEKSATNLQTSFQQSDIELYFDEYTVLKNAAQEIVVTPPLTYRIQPKLRGKKLTLEFNEKEELKDSITYQINFGEAIQDFHEGNILENYSYIFSTGPYIDSLSISGQVKDLEKGEGVENAIVVLYEDDRDSVVFDSKPFYYTKANKDGTFKLDYLRAGTYRIYAIEDKNNNKNFDLGSEKIGFLSENITLDTGNISGFDINLSLPEVPLRALKTVAMDSQLVLVLLSESQEDPINAKLGEGIDYWFFQNKDSLFFWIAEPLDSIQVEIIDLDTSVVYFNEKGPSRSLRFNVGSTVYTTEDTIWINGTTPLIDLVDSSGIVVQDTSGNYYEWNLLFDQKKPRLGVTVKLDSAQQVELIFMDSSIVDLYGRYVDSTNLKLDPIAPEELVDLTLKLVNIDSLTTNLIEVTSPINTHYKQTISPEDWRDTLIINLTDIYPTTINIELIEDSNGNGKFDPIQVFGRVQAEQRILRAIPALQPGVDLEQVIDFADKKSISSSETDQSKKEEQKLGPRRK